MSLGGWRLAAVVTATLGALSHATGVEAQESVTMSVPAGVSFDVTDVARATPGSPDPTIVTFANGTWPPPNGRRFRISIQANAHDFTAPGGGAIPASYVSWTASSSSGLASNGTLSASAYTQVFRTGPNTPDGSLRMTWTLQALDTISNLRAGNHALTVRWRLELQ
jgi:hypothetical protein